MILLAAVIALAATLHLAGSTESAAGLVFVYLFYRLWVYHNAASKREAEEAKRQAEERAIEEEDRRMVTMIRDAHERRGAEPAPGEVDPSDAAKAIGRMISGAGERPGGRAGG